MINKYCFHVPIDLEKLRLLDIVLLAVVWAVQIGFIVVGTAIYIREISLIVNGVKRTSELSSSFLYLINVYGIDWGLSYILIIVGLISRNIITILAAMTTTIGLLLKSFIGAAILVYGIRSCKELENDDLINNCEIALETTSAIVVFIMLIHVYSRVCLLRLYRMIHDRTRNQETQTY